MQMDFGFLAAKGSSKEPARRPARENHTAGQRWVKNIENHFQRRGDSRFYQLHPLIISRLNLSDFTASQTAPVMFQSPTPALWNELQFQDYQQSDCDTEKIRSDSTTDTDKKRCQSQLVSRGFMKNWENAQKKRLHVATHKQHIDKITLLAYKRYNPSFSFFFF